MGEILLLVLFAWLGYAIYSAIIHKDERADESPVYHWEPHPDYHYDFEVVGESNYQEAIKSIAGDHGARSPENEYVAKLVPEKHNPHDKSAVRVDIDGRKVGYMSREDARSFRRRLGAKKIAGQITSCNAMIIGGYVDRNGERVSYGVVLDMKPFE